MREGVGGAVPAATPAAAAVALGSGRVIFRSEEGDEGEC